MVLNVVSVGRLLALLIVLTAAFKGGMLPGCAAGIDLRRRQRQRPVGVGVGGVRGEEGLHGRLPGGRWRRGAGH